MSSVNMLDELLQTLTKSDFQDQRGKWLKILADALRSSSETAEKYDVVSYASLSDTSSQNSTSIKKDILTATLDDTR